MTSRSEKMNKRPQRKPAFKLQQEKKGIREAEKE